MFKVWVKEIKDNRLIKDITIEDSSDDTRTHKVFHALEKASREFDLPVPIWLDLNIKEFKKSARTRFRQDSYIEEIEFDYLDFQVLEED